MKKSILAVGVITLMMSCNSGSSIDTTLNVQNGEVVSKLAGEKQSPEELAKQVEELRVQKEEKERKELEMQTTIAFNKDVHDFGTVQPETAVTYAFMVKNTGDKPLIIENAKASCGCTIPKKPEEPISPGEEGEMEVTFKSKPGQKGIITKTVTVTANIPGKTTTVEIKANVEG